MHQQFATVGYSVAAIAFAALFFLTYSYRRGRTGGWSLAVASVTGAAWAALFAAGAWQGGLAPLTTLVVETSYDFAWLLFLATLLTGTFRSPWASALRWLGVATALAVLLVGALVVAVYPSPGAALVRVTDLGAVATSLAGLVGLEQVFRNARPAQRRGVRYMVVGLGAIFAYDLVTGSMAALAIPVDALWVAGRGYFVAMALPLIALYARRNPAWRQEVSVSREVLFYTSTLIIAAVYLAAVALVGYLVGLLGDELGPALQFIFLLGAALALVAAIMSSRFRDVLRVQIAKHFFEHKYDYRSEWLRLIQTLTQGEDGMPLAKRAVKALADIVGSPAGTLWLLDKEGRAFHVVTGWNEPAADAAVAVDDALPAFMENTGWVIDLRVLAKQPEKYPGLDAACIGDELRGATYITPLFLDTHLMGFISLDAPARYTTLNFEDHDVLKTAAKQIASQIAQEAATEQLAEHKQFEAFSRFTAYVMHDLKNAIAQQSLVVSNAEKHRRNPEFIDDAIETIRGSVARMRRVLDQLQQRRLDQPVETIDLTKLLPQARSHCSDRAPVPALTMPDRPVFVQANKDRLLMAICHAIRNAQDATPESGHVTMHLESDGSRCRIDLTDDGRGMPAEFVRERLFRPFDSTKGASGMGIGAYQFRETIRMFGGDVVVTSEPDQGTQVRLELPLTRSNAA